jgi:Glycosyltransferase family 87
MQARMQRLLTGLAALAVVALSLRVGAGMEPGLDYFGDAGPAIDALGRGDWHGFFANQPLMGSLSLFLRVPFVLPVFDGSIDAVYFAGAVPCLIATVVLGLALARMLAERGQSTAVQGLVAGLAVINPLTFKALHWGHPEDLLAAALCIGAVLAALRDRSLLSGLLLGLAVATKQWAVLAVLPALLAAPRRHVPLVGVAVAAAGAFMLPMAIGDLDGFSGVAGDAAGQTSGGASTTPWNVWWPLSHLVALPGGGGRWMAPDWVTRVSHPLIVFTAVPLTVLLWRRHDRRPDDALLLLALLFLLRCMLDNWDNDYYHLPFLLSLLAWETVRRPGIPRLTLAVTVLLGVSFWPEQTRVFADSADDAPLLFAGYMAWTVPLALCMAALLVRPGLLRQYHRAGGSQARPAAVRDRPRPGGDRQLDRSPA